MAEQARAELHSQLEASNERLTREAREKQALQRELDAANTALPAVKAELASPNPNPNPNPNPYPNPYPNPNPSRRSSLRSARRRAAPVRWSRKRSSRTRRRG